MGHSVTARASTNMVERMIRLLAAGAVVLVLSACSGGGGLFSAPKIKEEELIPPDQLYTDALAQMDRQRYATAITSLKKIEVQHPYSDYAEKAKLMIVYANFRLGKYDEAVLAADRYLAIYPSSSEVAYVLYLKGTSYYQEIKDITRDQEISRNALDTYRLLLSAYPDSEYSKDARDKMQIANDQLAGKEMSVGRYYLGNGQYTAAINRFRVVVDKYQTSSHIEEALYRLTEANLSIGLVNEAQTAAAVLGHNYPSSNWYQEAFQLLKKQGLEPKVSEGSPLASALQG